MRRAFVLASIAALVACGGDDAGSGGAGGEAASPASTTATSSSSGSVGGGGAGGGGDVVHLRVLAFNDFHGNVSAPSGSNGSIETPTGPVAAGGVAALADRIEELRAGAEHSIVVSAGDLVGASPLVSALFHDEPTIEVWNRIGLDLNGVGNHEFDKGQAELLRLQNGGCHPVDGCTGATPFTGANFQFLAANVVVDASGSTLFPRYSIKTFDGAKVAFVGMTLEATPAIVSPDGIEGLTFKDEVATVNALIPELEDQGVSAVVVLLHEGGYPTGFYDECVGVSGPIVTIAKAMSPRVDVIASGHTHQAYNCVIGGKIVTSAASFGRLLTQIDLDIDKKAHAVTKKTAKNLLVTRGAEDAGVASFVAHAEAAAAPLANDPSGMITADLTTSVAANGLSTMGAVIADADLDAIADGQVAFMNAGGVRAGLEFAASGGEASNGVVTYGELFTVQPFGDALVTMTLTGAQLKQLLEQQWSGGGILQVSSGFSYTFDPSAAPLSHVDAASLTVGGVAIGPSDQVRVVTNSYLASGGDGFSAFTQGADVLGGPLDINALRSYFLARSPVSPPALDRITVTP